MHLPLHRRLAFLRRCCKRQKQMAFSCRATAEPCAADVCAAAEAASLLPTCPVVFQDLTYCLRLLGQFWADKGLQVLPCACLGQAHSQMPSSGSAFKGSVPFLLLMSLGRSGGGMEWQSRGAIAALCAPLLF